jgi:DnaJ family protein C protein 28
MDEINQDNNKKTEDQPKRIIIRGATQRTNAIEEMIQEAMQAGDFDNLRGRGKPLRLEKNLFAEDKELAYKLLKDNDYTLPWIADRLDTLARVDALRQEIGRQYHIYHEEYGRARSPEQRALLDHAWRATYNRLQAEVEALNRRITAVNLALPSPKLEILKLKLDREIEKLEAES